MKGMEQSEFFLNSTKFRMSLPKIYAYVGNRLTQMNLGAASAFKTVVNEIGKEIWSVWQKNPNYFSIRPGGQPPPRTAPEFRRMFQAEINDANTASVVSGGLGIPIFSSYRRAPCFGGPAFPSKSVSTEQAKAKSQALRSNDRVKKTLAAAGRVIYSGRRLATPAARNAGASPPSTVRSPPRLAWCWARPLGRRCVPSWRHETDDRGRTSAAQRSAGWRPTSVLRLSSERPRHDDMLRPSNCDSRSTLGRVPPCQCRYKARASCCVCRGST